MGHVTGYENDVFVSYSHQDDSPLVEGAAGWITTFTRQLEKELAKRLGSRTLKVWRDPRLAGNEPLTPQLLEAIRRSATLLVVMSPSYLTSEWCSRERDSFLSFARDCVGQGRIFIVRHRETERDQAPPELGDLVGYKFYVKDLDSGVDRPLDDADRDYVQRLYDFSHQLANKLKDLSEPASPAAAMASPAQPKRSVFLARSTDDLEGQEDELKAYLTQAGIEVAPRTWYPETNAESFSAAMARDLAQCKVFVQLLSGSHGRKVAAAADQRLPRLQYEIALKSKTPVLQWRDQKLDFAQVQDPHHRELLDGARACRFEDLKRDVLEEVRREAVAPPALPSNVLTYVDAEAGDLSIAENVGSFLAEQGIDCVWPVRTGTPEQVRRDLEQHLASCDGIILVYGKAEPFWVRDQLLQIRKIVSQRERPPAALALYVAPPAEKGELGFRIPKLMTLDCRGGTNPDVLRSFLQQVRARAA